MSECIGELGIVCERCNVISWGDIPCMECGQNEFKSVIVIPEAALREMIADRRKELKRHNDAAGKAEYLSPSHIIGQLRAEIDVLESLLPSEGSEANYEK